MYGNGPCDAKTLSTSLEGELAMGGGRNAYRQEGDRRNRKIFTGSLCPMKSFGYDANCVPKARAGTPFLG